MKRAEIDLITNAGRDKLKYLAAHPGRYFARSAVAGAYVMVGTLLSIACAAWFYDTSMGTAKLLGAFTFSAALILVVLIGGELFTGTNFVLGVSLYEKKARLGAVVRLWAVCYLGNLAGILILAAIVTASGASGALLSGYLAQTVPARLECGAVQLLCKGAMCNFLVCTGVFGGMKLTSESGKCVAVAAVITTFVLLGFEHSIANMATLSLYAMLVPEPDFMGILWHMLWVTLGNILGGAMLLGLPVWWSAEPACE